MNVYLTNEYEEQFVTQRCPGQCSVKNSHGYFSIPSDILFTWFNNVVNF